MSRPFLSRSAIVDVIKSEERMNSIQKRNGTDHPVRFTVCGCPDPNCGSRLRIVRTGKRRFSHAETTAVPLPSESEQR